MGFSLSGYLLSAYCPARSQFASDAAWHAAKVNAHYIWYVFTAIAIASAISLIIFDRLTRERSTNR